MRAWHLVAYDVRDDRRLRRVERIVSGYGERLQYSVYRCRLNGIERERLLWELSTALAPVDSLLVIPLCQHCAGAIHGRGHRASWGTPPGYRVV